MTTREITVEAIIKLSDKLNKKEITKLAIMQQHQLTERLISISYSLKYKIKK